LDRPNTWHKCQAYYRFAASPLKAGSRSTTMFLPVREIATTLGESNGKENNKR
jgi:hypothetical protein